MTHQTIKPTNDWFYWIVDGVEVRWFDVVIGHLDSMGYVVCYRCLERRSEAKVYIESTYCNETCHTCGVNLSTGFGRRKGWV